MALILRLAGNLLKDKRKKGEKLSLSLKSYFGLIACNSSGPKVLVLGDLLVKQ